MKYLPLEVLNIIFKYCDFSSTLNLRQVSRGLRCAVDGSNIIRSNLCLDLDNNDFPLEITTEWFIWRLTNKHLLQHKQNGLEYWLSHTRDIVIAGGYFYSEEVLRTKLPNQLDCLLDILENEVPNSPLELLSVNVNLYAKWGSCFESIITRLNSSPLAFSVNVNIDLDGVECINTPFGGKFNSMNFKLHHGEIKWFEPGNALESLSISKSCALSVGSIPLSIRSISDIIYNCKHLTSVEFCDVTFTGGEYGWEHHSLPESLSRMAFYDCGIDEDGIKKKNSCITGEGIEDLLLQNVNGGLIKMLNFPALKSLRLWNLDVKSTLFLTHLLPSLSKLTLDVGNWGALDILSSGEMLSDCALKHLHLNVWEGEVHMDKVWKLTNLTHLQTLAVCSNDLGNNFPSKESVRNLDSFVKALLQSCQELTNLSLYLGVNLPRVTMSGVMIRKNRQMLFKRMSKGMLVREYNQMINLDEHDDRIPAWVL